MTIGGFQTEIEALRRGFQLEEELNRSIHQTRLERDTLIKHCSKLVELNALADIQVKNVHVEPYSVT